MEPADHIAHNFIDSCWAKRQCNYRSAPKKKDTQAERKKRYKVRKGMAFEKDERIKKDRMGRIRFLLLSRNENGPEILTSPLPGTRDPLGSNDERKK